MRCTYRPVGVFQTLFVLVSPPLDTLHYGFLAPKNVLAIALIGTKLVFEDCAKPCVHYAPQTSHSKTGNLSRDRPLGAPAF